MSRIFYNPITCPNAPMRKITEVGPVDPKWARFAEGRTYASLEDALADCTYAGGVYFLADGVLMKGYCRQPWEFQAVTADKYIEPGINWATAYFLSLSDAEKFSDELETRHDAVQYSWEYDVYSVHYHF